MPSENRSEYSWYILNVQKDNSQSEKNVKQSHKWDQLFGDMANSFDSAKKDHGDQNGNYDSDDQVEVETALSLITL